LCEIEVVTGKMSDTSTLISSPSISEMSMSHDISDWNKIRQAMISSKVKARFELKVKKFFWFVYQMC
jgi:hypothetical protein